MGNSMSNTETLVFDIEKFAVHDGPGIRTVVFMKGCPLHCLWCHNPESQSFRKEVFFNSAKCTFCGQCISSCPKHCHSIGGNKHLFDRKKCMQCGKCAENCLTEALKICGREMSVKEVMKEVLKDKAFYENSGGGLTLSGGEPLAHIDFTFALLEAAKKEKVHTAVETCGFAPWERIEKILPLTDLWLWDIKAAAAKHEELTGVPFEPILANLRKISDSDGQIILRCPLIPEVNDTEDHLISIGQLADSLKGVQQIELEPYHPLGESKSLHLGRSHVFHSEFVTEEKKRFWLDILKKYTTKNLVIY